MKKSEFRKLIREEVKKALNEAKVKDFNLVKPGDMAKDYHGEKWKVLAKGTGKDFKRTLAKYDQSGIANDMLSNPSAYGMSKSDANELKLIAVQMDDETAVFAYEPDGARVYENLKENASKIKPFSKFNQSSKI